MDTMLDLINAHLKQFAAEPTSRGTRPRPKTMEAHRLNLEHFAETFDKTGADPGSLSVNFCKDYFLSIGENAGVSKRNQILSALTEFLRWLVNDNRLTNDQFTQWKHFHKKQYRYWKRGAPNHKFLRPEPLAALMTALSRNGASSIEANRNLAFFGLIFLGPSRLGEVRLIDCEHITPPNEKSPHFKIAVPPENAKNGKPHTLKLSPGSVLGGRNIYAAMESYYAWRMAQSNTGAFFIALRIDWNLKRPTAGNWHSIMKTAANRAGLKCTSHWLRHTFGEIAASVLDGRDLRQLYGHSNETVTRTYTDHDNDDRLEDARASVINTIANY